MVNSSSGCFVQSAAGIATLLPLLGETRGHRSVFSVRHPSWRERSSPPTRLPGGEAELSVVWPPTALRLLRPRLPADREAAPPARCSSCAWSSASSSRPARPAWISSPFLFSFVLLFVVNCFSVYGNFVAARRTYSYILYFVFAIVVCSPALLPPRARPHRLSTSLASWSGRVASTAAPSSSVLYRYIHVLSVLDSALCIGTSCTLAFATVCV